MRKYPKNRRSPVRHEVRSFKRGNHTVKAHHRGSGKITSGARRAGRLVSRLKTGLSYEAERRLKQRMLESCFQGTKAERLSARIALKEHYPELYEEAGFNEGDKRRKAPEIIKINPRMIEQRR